MEFDHECDRKLKIYSEYHCICLYEKMTGVIASLEKLVSVIPSILTC